MAMMLKPWTVLVAVALCVLVCLGALADAYPPNLRTPVRTPHPKSWPSTTRPETLHQPDHKAEVYTHVVQHSTQRYGKRSAQEDMVAELLFGADSNRDQRSRYDDSYMW
ncbi:hypothetical protein INR49_009574 [Caranx melampygus]|nr:hypothetical protein INR49_009574 [Caranx melampygus]